jgi:hypothetical protein
MSTIQQTKSLADLALEIAESTPDPDAAEMLIDTGVYTDALVALGARVVIDHARHRLRTHAARLAVQTVNPPRAGRESVLANAFKSYMDSIVYGGKRLGDMTLDDLDDQALAQRRAMIGAQQINAVMSRLATRLRVAAFGVTVRMVYTEEEVREVYRKVLSSGSIADDDPAPAKPKPKRKRTKRGR